MYLKSLTLRGFKSFASSTTLRLEPGITCVVGPNGSGKSNVVDALSWVMGEQGAKSLRGGKMEDVIFAGTTNRAPLGRAEVALTIDNSDGALPIDYAEVTISRLMFRSGQSEYAINGDSCRLLDVQDLLSDSGLGREMHVIVGQGQLDQILHAGPEARRAIIEEAAGVLKHRKRKEKALRKLDAMQANLTRLVDLTGELGRRLKPLGRQAEVARKAATIQADLRDAKLRLLADDYVQLRDKLEREEADEAAIRARRAELEAALAAARERETAFDVAVQAQAAALTEAQQTWFQLSSLTEKLRSTQGLAAERAKLLAADTEPERPGRDPDELERQAAELRDEEAGLTERLTEGREALAESVAERTMAENTLAAAERRLADAARAAAGRAERLARLRGMVDAAASRAAATGEEIDRLTAAAEQARARAERARQEYSQVQDVADDGACDRSGLAAELEAAQREHNQRAERVVAARKAERAANSAAAALRARTDALNETLRQGVDATTAVLADPERFRGVLGSFAAQLTVADGYQKAIASALGAAAEALTVTGLDAAAALEVTSIHSVAGYLAPGAGLMTVPPFCAPHHTSSMAAIVGGGGSVIRPGAASLAHNGILFLDEAPEFHRDVLDALRQPLESGEVVIARASTQAVFPARFTLVLAANPCPCAKTAGPGKTGCSCSPAARRRYLARVSGPLLDRVDLKVRLQPVSRSDMLYDRKFAEPSAVVAQRVIAARERCAVRFAGTPWRVNAEVPGPVLRRSYPPNPAAVRSLDRAMELGQVSARGADKIVRVAWSLADLAGADQPGPDQVNLAIGLWLGVPH